MFARTIMTLAVLACAVAATAGPASIWGSGSTKKDTQDAPKAKSVSPYAAPMPQTAPPAWVAPSAPDAPKIQKPKQTTVAPAPEPTWSLQDVPSDPTPTWKEPMPEGRLPPVVMDKKEMMEIVKDPEMRKYLEQFSEGDAIVMPQNPPEMNEETSKILPYSQTEIPDIPGINGQESMDFYQDCPSGNCPEMI
jgi:hypothetical protein